MKAYFRIILLITGVLCFCWWAAVLQVREIEQIKLAPGNRTGPGVVSPLFYLRHSFGALIIIFCSLLGAGLLIVWRKVQSRSIFWASSVLFALAASLIVMRLIFDYYGIQGSW